MKPKIVAVAGVSEGAVIELGGETFTIGRDTVNHLSLDDRMVSRCHSVIKKEKGLYKVRDLESHNGTLVNGIPVNEQILNHGDRIQVGGSLFLFLLYEDKELPESNEIEFDDDTVLNRSEVSFRLEDALYSMARDLNLLMKVGQIINSANSLKALERQLLESIFDAIPAERGAILLSDEGLDGPISVFALDKVLGDKRPIHVSRTVAHQVLSEAVAVLSDNVPNSDMLSKSESLMEGKVRSLLCVPLVLRSQVVGLIYLEASDEGVRFTERHMQVVMALTAFVSGPLSSMRHLEWLESENRRLNDDIRLEHSMVGESAKMSEVYQFIAKVAPTDSTVMLRGESGTGKELAARAIHHNSPRAAKPLVSINCAALTETLLESELFGHEKGAFTGAYAQKKGKLEIADGGTLFLDEVAEMSPQAQAKLLRVLQEREFERVGGTRSIKVNVRIVAATNKPLEQLVRDDGFRQDLYYRLNVISRTMPPLRERREDISLLASYFVVKYASKCKRQVIGLSEEARACLASYDWPGNVRELENAMERAVVLGTTARVQVEDLPEHIIEASPPSDRQQTNYHELLREAKRQVVLKALGQSEGNYTEAAKSLGMHPNNLHRLMRNVGLK